MYIPGIGYFHELSKRRKTLGMLPRSWKAQFPQNPARLSIAIYMYLYCLTSEERVTCSRKSFLSHVYIKLYHIEELMKMDISEERLEVQTYIGMSTNLL